MCDHGVGVKSTECLSVLSDPTLRNRYVSCPIGALSHCTPGLFCLCGMHSSVNGNLTEVPPHEFILVCRRGT